MGNAVLNIFSFDNFLKKKKIKILRNNQEKLVSGGMTIFEGKGHQTTKMNKTFVRNEDLNTDFKFFPKEEPHWLN